MTDGSIDKFMDGKRRAHQLISEKLKAYEGVGITWATAISAEQAFKDGLRFAADVVASDITTDEKGVSHMHR